MPKKPTRPKTHVREKPFRSLFLELTGGEGKVSFARSQKATPVCEVDRDGVIATFRLHKHVRLTSKLGFGCDTVDDA